MEYEIVDVLGMPTVKRTDDDGTVWWVPSDPANTDYQQYLIDTDGGLPIPEGE